MPLSLTSLIGCWIASGHLAGARVVDVRLDQPGPHELRWAVLDRVHPTLPGRIVVGVEDHRFTPVRPGTSGSGPDFQRWA